MKRAASVPDIQFIDNSQSATGKTTKRPRNSRARAKQSNTSIQISQAPSQQQGDGSVSQSSDDAQIASASGAPNFSLGSVCRDDVQSLKSEIIVLKNTVSVLSSKLEFVLSFHGISECPSNTHAGPSINAGSVTEFPELAGTNTHVSTALPSVAATTSLPGSTGLTNNMSYRDAVRTNLVKSMKSELLSAVHTELNIKNKRSSNVIIHGLPSTSDAVGADLDHVRDFINVEFCNSGFDWNIVACHRLGQRHGNKSGSTASVNAAVVLNADGSRKFLPLLVTLGCSQQAKYLVENARKLRRSMSEYTKLNVFINADMTVAESKAAYDQRCRRRERLASRSAAVVGGVRQENSSAATRADNIAGHVRGDDHSTVSAAAADCDVYLLNRSVLDPAVNPFCPRPPSDAMTDRVA